MAMVFLGERLTLAGAIGSTTILVGVIWAGRKNHWGEGDNDLPGIFLSLLPEDNSFFLHTLEQWGQLPCP